MEVHLLFWSSLRANYGSTTEEQVEARQQTTDINSDSILLSTSPGEHLGVHMSLAERQSTRTSPSWFMPVGCELATVDSQGPSSLP